MDFADNPDMSVRLFKNVMLRRLFCTTLVCILIPLCSAQDNTSDTAELFTAEVLKRELFARTPEDRQFCDYVIKKRDDGTIPARIIYAVYRKAITQDKNKRFLYFKTALETLCRREGIVLNPSPVSTASPTPSFTLPRFRLPSAFRTLF